MPLYEYECVKCGKHVERIEKFSGPKLKKCPSCGGGMERLLSAPAIQFKGSGWYVTDYGRPSKGSTSDKAPASETQSSGNSKADDKEDGKGEAKVTPTFKDNKKKPLSKER